MPTKPKTATRPEPIIEKMVVSGVISIEETAQGIPGLAVEIYHIGKSPVRLSSTVTGSAGRFSATIDKDQIKKLPINSLNIQLMLLTPERPALARKNRVLFESEVRERAALREVFMVEVPEGLLVKKGLQRVVNNARPLAERKAEALREASETTRIVSETANKLEVEKIEEAVKRRRFFSDVVAPRVRRELSTLSEKEQDNPRFVPVKDEISTRSAQAQHDQLVMLSKTEQDNTGATIKKVRRHTRMHLKEDELTRLGLDQPDSTAKSVTQEELEDVLGVSLDKPTSIQRTIEPTDPCRALLPGEICLNEDGNPSETEENGDAGTGEEERDPNEEGSENGDVPGENVSFDSKVAIAALMDPQTSPEHTVRFENKEKQLLEGKLNANELATAIGGITLTPGPADVPSFHDFSSLQLAFESVWQEAIDDRILDDVESAYDRIVENGLEHFDFVQSQVAGDRPVKMGILERLAETRSANDFVVNVVPDSVAANVHISLEEYAALTGDLRRRLKNLTSAMDGMRGQLVAALDSTSITPEDDEGGGQGGGKSSWDFIPDPIKNTIEKAFELGTLPITVPTDFALKTHKTLTDLLFGQTVGEPTFNRTAISLLERIRIYQAQANKIVHHARQIVIDRERRQTFRPNHEIIKRLRTARSKAYPFKHFAASPSQRSVNFGVMITYRQLWTPVSYQVGDLVKTIPLGPKESRKYSKKVVQKRRRLEKELESNLSNSKFDSETKSRAEAQILAKASGKTSFSNTSKGSFEYGMEGGMSAGGESTTAFKVDAERHSENTKKNMRESVLKASEERRRETKMEIEAEESFESEFTESGELMNPNDEITCTFLFYELQRRYRINEKLHRLQSVVLVAQEMPEASEIDSVWLIQHDWIINRVLLDNSFKPALSYVSTTLVSDQETLSYMRKALFDQQMLVEQIQEDLADRRSSAGLRYAALERQIERTAQDAEGKGLIWDTVSDAVSGGGLLGGILGGGEEGEDNASKIREDAAREAWDRERKEEQAFRSRLIDAQSTLATMRSEFNDKLSKHLAEVTQVERLATHIYQNIMHYMQAIWAHEPDDQRFLRLRDVPVPNLRPNKPRRRLTLGNITISSVASLDPDRIVGFDTEYGIATIPPQPEDIPTLPLAEVGDLSNPLGFMGNYMILPMYETNSLTDFMMDPYVTFAEGEYGVSDPDPAGNMSLEEFSNYVCCLKKELGADRFKEVAPTLRDKLKHLLQRSVRNNEEIIVGTGNLYIEALPGAHSIMEQFKHLHRQIDVKTAQEELRTKAIDNVRRAERILKESLEDPDIEAKYVFEGNGSATVVAPAPGGGDSE